MARDLVDGVHALDDAAEHRLRLGLAPAQLAGELAPGCRACPPWCARACRPPAVPPTGIEVEKSPWPRRSAASRRARRAGRSTCWPRITPASTASAPSTMAVASSRRTRPPTDVVDLAGRQARFEQRDRLAGRREHREARRVEIRDLDAQHRGAAVGETRGMQARELVDALVLDERAVVDEPDRHADVLGEICASRRRAAARRYRRRPVAPPICAERRAPRTRADEGTARKRSPCSAADVTISSHGSSTPACATSLPPSNTAHATIVSVLQEAAQDTGRGVDVARSASRRCSVWRSATLSRVRERVLAVRRRSSRAIAPASCTRACPADPRGRAACRSRRTRCRRPPAARSPR